MSRVGKEPVPIPQGVEVKTEGGILIVKGPQGSLEFKPHPRMKLEIETGQVLVRRSSDEKEDKSLHGVTRSLIKNMVEGVTKGFSKELDIIGVGFRAQLNEKKLTLSLGFSHPIEYNIPDGITIELPTNTKIVVKGLDKAKVGEVASEIRAFHPPEPYKGKGVRYRDEVVRRKAGKAVAATT